MKCGICHEKGKEVEIEDFEQVGKKPNGDWIIKLKPCGHIYELPERRIDALLFQLGMRTTEEKDKEENEEEERD